MSRWAATMLAAVGGVVVGAVATLSMPVPAERPVETPASTAAPELVEEPVRTLLAWTPTRLPDGFAEAVRALEGVAAATEVRSGTLWLDAWSDADGSRSEPPEGFRVPVEVAAIDVDTYAPFVPPVLASLFEGLAEEDAVLGERGAALRGIGEGGRLHTGGSSLAVAGVVDDTLIGAHEAAMSREVGEALGVVRPRYLLVAVGEGADADTVQRSVREAVPAGTRVRVRGPGETPAFRHGDAVLPPVELKELFGEFAAAPTGAGNLDVDPSWVSEHIVARDVPLLGTVRCHRRILPQLEAAMEEISRRGLGDRIDPEGFGGCFFPRFLNQAPGAGISHHSWGVAFDLNVPENPYGATPRLDERLVDVLERWGFTWGGRWLVPDGMHFEFLRWPLSPKG